MEIRTVIEYILLSVFTQSRGTQMTKAMAAMLVPLTKIFLYEDTNMAAMISSANAL